MTKEEDETCCTALISEIPECSGVMLQKRKTFNWKETEMYIFFIKIIARDQSRYLGATPHMLK